MPRKSKSAVLFDDEAQGVRREEKFVVNQRFATKYEDHKRKQDLDRARELGINLNQPEEEEDLSSEDEGEELTADIDKKIKQTLKAIRKRDPRIYDASTTFFEKPSDEAEPAAAVEEAAAEVPRKKKSKKLLAKDVLREQLVDAAERGVSDAFAEDDEDEGVTLSKKARKESVKVKVYDEEQAALRKAFLESAVGGDDAASEHSAAGDAVEDDAGLVKRKRTVAAKGKKAAAAASDSEQEEGGDGESSDADSTDRRHLRKYMAAKGKRGIAEHAAELADPEAFLKAFMNTKAWKEEEEEDAFGTAPVADEVDEVDVEKADNFEAKYNFRCVRSESVGVSVCVQCVGSWKWRHSSVTLLCH